MFGTARQKLVTTAAACLVGLTALASAATVWVDGSFAGVPDGSEANPWPTIQQGVDNAADGDTVFIKAGVYADPVNIDNRDDLTIQGEDRDTVILEPTSLVNWDAFGHTTARQTAIRVFESTDIAINDLTIDMNIVTANGRYAIFYAESTGELDTVYIHSNNTGTTAYGIYVRANAAPYDPSSRAVVAVRNSEIRDAGRVGIGSHDFTHLIIDNNEIYKTECFPGYGIDLSSHSTGDVTNNTIHGHNARFPSDGSAVAGIYISNAFTNPTVPGITKPILVSNNHIYNNMSGLVVGNQWNTFAGDVQIVLTLEDNDISENNQVCNAHLFASGNATYGLMIADEDAENGSSVTVNASGNNISNNGDYGVFQYGVDDAEVSSTFTNNIITGNDYGVVLMDFGADPTDSTHSMTLTDNNISDNNTYNAYTDGSAGTDIEANDNYWGDSTGPGGTVSPGVTVTTFLADDPNAPDFLTFAVSALSSTNNVDPTSYTSSVNVTAEFTYSGNEPHELVVSESSDFTTSTSIPLSSGQDTATFTVSSGDGPKTVYAKLAHFAAESTELSDTIMLDTTAPASGATAPAGTLLTSTPVIDVEYTVTEAGSGVQSVTLFYQFNGGAWTQYGTTFASSPIAFDTTTEGEGQYGFYTVAMDNAGNEESKTAAAETEADVQYEVTSVEEWLSLELTH